MTTAAFTPVTPKLVSGIGPYQIGHEYNEGSIRCWIVQSGAQVFLDEAEFSIAPVSSETSGDMYLTAQAASDYDGEYIYLVRDTLAEQDWIGQGGNRETSLEKQMDRITRGMQELQDGIKRTLKIPVGQSEMPPIIGDPDDRADRAFGFDEAGNPVVGPTFDQIEEAENFSIAAAASASSALRRFDVVADVIAATNISVGQYVYVSEGKNGKEEAFKIYPAGTYTADANLVVDLTGISGQAVSTRTVFVDFADLAKFTSSMVAVGDTVKNTLTDITYQRVASGGQFDYTGMGGVEFTTVAGARAVYPVPSGVSTSDGFAIWDYTEKGAFRSELIDTSAGRNDENNYGRGAASTDWEGDPDNIGLLSTSFGRGNLTYGYLSTAFGHSNSPYGTASMAGGAGSSTGDPDDPLGSFIGYCALAWGKNTQALGTKSFALNEETRAHGRASGAIGHSTYAGPSLASHGGIIGGTTVDDSGLGAFASGWGSIAYGNYAIASGYYVKSYGSSMTWGSGINPGSPLTNVIPGSLGFGANVTRATLNVLPGPGTTSGVGAVAVRGAFQIWSYDGDELTRISNTLTNGGSGGSYRTQIDTRVAGAIARGFDVDGGSGVMSLLPATANTHRIGSAALPISYGWIQNAWIVTSDARRKTEPKAIDERALRAWAKVDRVQYLLLNEDGKPEVGGDINVGVVAQDIVAAFKSEGLDAFDWALVIEGDKRGDGGFLGVNYTQCECFEAKLVRGRLSEIEARLAKLEAA